MLRATGIQTNGRKAVVLGIDAENVKRLQEGKPIHVDGASLGVPVDVMLFYGETNKHMLADLREAGVELPPGSDIQ